MFSTFACDTATGLDFADGFLEIVFFAPNKNGAPKLTMASTETYRIPPFVGLVSKIVLANMFISKTTKAALVYQARDDAWQDRLFARMCSALLQRRKSVPRDVSAALAEVAGASATCRHVCNFMML